MSNKHYDIVIAGGGMIGTSLALALEPLGLKRCGCRSDSKKSRGPAQLR